MSFTFAREAIREKVCCERGILVGSSFPVDAHSARGVKSSLLHVSRSFCVGDY